MRLKFVNVECSLCGSNNYQLAYERLVKLGNDSTPFTIRNVLCNDCGLMFQNPRPTQESLHEYYQDDNYASGNTYHSAEQNSRYGVLAKERKAFVMKQKLPSGGSLLDVGCGLGDFLAELRLPNWHQAGLEQSPDASEITRRRGLEVINASLEETPSSLQGHFDLVTCNSVLEHLYKPNEAIAKMGTLLKPSGNLMIEVPDSIRPIPQISEFYSHEHLTHFTRGTLSRMLAMNDFEITDIDRTDFPHLRVWCRKRIGYSRTYKPSDDRDVLLAALERYAKQRIALEQKIKERLKPHIDKWSKENSRVALYGAGLHSEFLLNVLNIERYLYCLIDGDKKKQGGYFRKWPIYAPEKISQLSLDAIIISSKAFQDEIYDSIKHHDIQVIKCYENQYGGKCQS